MIFMCSDALVGHYDPKHYKGKYCGQKLYIKTKISRLTQVCAFLNKDET